jgi:hypothetical protein
VFSKVHINLPNVLKSFRLIRGDLESIFHDDQHILPTDNSIDAVYKSCHQCLDFARL